MALHLKALDGPNKDVLVLVRAGMAIGRTEGDIIVPDDKRLSGRHAYIESGENEQFYIVDNGSKNGLRVENAAVLRMALTAGLKILIGTYTYEVVDAEHKVSEQKSKARHWQEVVVDHVGRQISNVKNETTRVVLPLKPALVLDFIRGNQAETRWVLGYGPRKVGATSIDLPIFEPGAPDVCFEIFPTSDGISFKTDHPELVTLNGKPISSEIIHIADIIKIQDTEIEVDFI